MNDNKNGVNYAIGCTNTDVSEKMVFVDQLAMLADRDK